ncbi:hypothetical protein [Serratia marcescens]|uniref:hypothetical protein n=1 Tax=Serratia marcescens TaxID=615 RepID=UPI0028148AA4|nr:hypothetical protein [Serratia marcescens]MDQ9783681.1 hypothetical protein [Serratia marcescens]
MTYHHHTTIRPQEGKTLAGFDKATSDARYAAALKAEREAAQARYVSRYGHSSALYSEKGPFK